MLYKIGCCLLAIGSPASMAFDLLNGIYYGYNKHWVKELWIVPVGILTAPFLLLGFSICYWTKSNDF